MATANLSVIIPTFNNLATLPKILERLEKQATKLPCEIIAVDNGSSDGSVEFLRDYQKKNGGFMKVLIENKKGAAAARNTGAMVAISPWLLFLGGDIIPDDTLLQRHIQNHQKMPDTKIGVLGFVTWDPLLPPTPFMVFLENGGPQNAFGEIAGKDFVDPRKYFYGSNISLKKQIFMETGGFDTDNFPGYGWEDLELGMRLADKGFRLFYEPQARGWHSHKVTVKNVEERMLNVGKAYVFLKELHPSVEGINMIIERRKYWPRRILYGGLIAWIIKRFAYWCERRFIAAGLFRRVISLPFYIGVHGAMLNKGKSVDKHNG